MYWCTHVDTTASVDLPHWASLFKSSTLPGRHNMSGVHRLWLEFGGSNASMGGLLALDSAVLLAWGTLLFYIGGHLVRDTNMRRAPAVSWRRSSPSWSDWNSRTKTCGAWLSHYGKPANNNTLHLISWLIHLVLTYLGRWFQK